MTGLPAAAHDADGIGSWKAKARLDQITQKLEEKENETASERIALLIQRMDQKRAKLEVQHPPAEELQQTSVEPAPAHPMPEPSAALVFAAGILLARGVTRRR